MARGTVRKRSHGDVIDRRVGLLFGGFMLLLVFALARSVYIGLVQAKALQLVANQQVVAKDVLPPVRGTITDRNGVVLALSEAADQVDADPYVIKNPTGVAAKLAPLLGISGAQLYTALTKPHTGYSPLALDVPESTAIRIMGMGINGLWTVPVERRVYPEGTLAAQVLGFVKHSDNQGLGGLEYSENAVLSGRAGLRKRVLDEAGQAVSVDTVRPMVPGKTLQLTLSASLQARVEQVLAGVGAEYHPKSATAIVMDPRSSQILALANWPALNVNDITASSNTSDMAVEFSYEPGSTFKAVTVAGALQDGLVTPQTTFDVPPSLDPYGFLIQDAEPHGYETLSVSNILWQSSNIGADLIGQKLGAARFSYWVHRFGFGRPTGVDLPGEADGVIRPLDKYDGVSMWNFPFGQGQEVTPIQMADVYSAIANGGILRTPRIIQAIGGKPVPEPKGVRVLSPPIAAELRAMLRGVLSDQGTASGAAIPGYDLAGKTGTAQIAVNGRYSATEFVASFIGMVPASDPKLVVAVVVNQPQGAIYGGSVAAPAFQKIVSWAVPYFGINPCPAPCPESAINPATATAP
jgi:cell division protein FtsI/penicillin-binding protein 2